MGINDIAENHTFIIAELSANHNQDFNVAVKTIEAMASAGADAVKVQTYKPESLAIDINNEYFGHLKNPIWAGMTRYQLYKSACMPYDWHEPLKKVAENNGLVFFSTPFDLEGVDILEKVNIPIYKIASFEINDIPLIKKVAMCHKPIIMSTGCADYHDIQLAIDACHEMGNDNISLLKCTSEYPASYEQANLNTIPDLAKTFNCTVGVSDHTMGYIVPMTAVALGARIIERHFILSRDLGGADATFSMEPDEFKLMVDNVRKVEKTFGHIVREITDYDRGKRRAIYATVDIHPGDVFTNYNTGSYRPGNGLSPQYYEIMLGQNSHRFIRRGEPVLLSDIKL